MTIMVAHYGRKLIFSRCCKVYQKKVMVHNAYQKLLKINLFCSWICLPDCYGNDYSCVVGSFNDWLWIMCEMHANLYPSLFACVSEPTSVHFSKILNIVITLIWTNNTTRLNPLLSIWGSLHCDANLFVRRRGDEGVEVIHLVAPAECVSLGCGHIHLQWPVDPLLHSLLTGFNSY